MGGCRKILGSATLFAHVSLWLGAGFAFLETTLIPKYKGFLLMLLPPRAFLVLGFLLTGKRAAGWSKVQTGVQQSPSAACRRLRQDPKRTAPQRKSTLLDEDKDEDI
ncbi:MAG: hypothetical protein JNK95_04510 [Candidatus Competibacter sp.]|nr:hypothetical protein [Candidatus Competibacter sp.]